MGSFQIQLFFLAAVPILSIIFKFFNFLFLKIFIIFLCGFLSVFSSTFFFLKLFIYLTNNNFYSIFLGFFFYYSTVLINRLNFIYLLSAHWINISKHIFRFTNNKKKIFLKKISLSSFIILIHFYFTIMLIFMNLFLFFNLNLKFSKNLLKKNFFYIYILNFF